MQESHQTTTTPSPNMPRHQGPAKPRRGRPPKVRAVILDESSTLPAVRTVAAKQKFPAVSLGLGKVRAQITVITPELAARWLANHPQVQRPRNPSLVAMIVRAIDENRWEFNGEPIIFNDAGELADGQHRLAACIESGKPIVALVIYGMPKQAFWTIDTGKSRSGPDALKASGYNYTTALASFALMAWKHERGMDPAAFFPDKDTKIRPRLSPQEIRETLAKYPEVMDYLPAITEAARVIRATGLALFCYHCMHKIDAEATAEFFEKLGSGEDLRKGQPIYELRRRFLGGRGELVAPEKIRLMFKAWNAYRKGETIGSLRASIGDPLPELV
jgi:hypothetical protein